MNLGATNGGRCGCRRRNRLQATLNLPNLVMAGLLLGCLGAGCPVDPVGTLCTPKEREAFRLVQRCEECGVISEADQIYDSCAELAADLQEGFADSCEALAPEDCGTYDAFLDLAVAVYQLCEADCP